MMMLTMTLGKLWWFNTLVHWISDLFTKNLADQSSMIWWSHICSETSSRWTLTKRNKLNLYCGTEGLRCKFCVYVQVEVTIELRPKMWSVPEDLIHGIYVKKKKKEKDKKPKKWNWRWRLTLHIKRVTESISNQLCQLRT